VLAPSSSFWSQAAFLTEVVVCGFGNTSPANFISSSLRSAASVFAAIHEIAFDSRHVVSPAGRLRQ
jgi:hypothetical protein